MNNPFIHKPIILKDIQIPAGEGYTMNGTVVEVVHELQENCIMLQIDKNRLQAALRSKQEYINRLQDDISSLHRRIFQMKHEAKAR